MALTAYILTPTLRLLIGDGIAFDCCLGWKVCVCVAAKVAGYLSESFKTILSEIACFPTFKIGYPAILIYHCILNSVAMQKISTLRESASLA